MVNACVVFGYNYIIHQPILSLYTSFQRSKLLFNFGNDSLVELGFGIKARYQVEFIVNISNKTTSIMIILGAAKNTTQGRSNPINIDFFKEHLTSCSPKKVFPTNFQLAWKF